MNSSSTFTVTLSAGCASAGDIYVFQNKGTAQANVKFTDPLVDALGATANTQLAFTTGQSLIMTYNGTQWLLANAGATLLA